MSIWNMNVLVKTNEECVKYNEKNSGNALKNGIVPSFNPNKRNMNSE